MLSTQVMSLWPDWEQIFATQLRSNSIGALRVSTGYKFFYEKRLVKISQLAVTIA